MVFLKAVTMDVGMAESLVVLRGMLKVDLMVSLMVYLTAASKVVLKVASLVE
jgi:hypothetical protein